LRTKEEGTHLTLNEHVDDDDELLCKNHVSLWDPRMGTVTL